jgi:two-component system response regulator HupR/HoxA
MRLGSRSFDAFSTNISVTGIYLRVAEQAKSLVSVGDRVELEFQLPNENRLIETLAEVVWIHPADRDAAGRSVVGLGMQLVAPAPAVVDQIASFVRHFRYTVLVVDDDPDVLELLNQLLGTEYRVLTATSAAQALSMLEQFDVAVLITDYQLPEMTSLELLARLGENLPYSRVVRIVVSAAVDSDRLQQLLNVGGIFHYLRKPFLAADVLHVVQRGVETYALLVENDRLNADLTRANERLRRENEHLRRYVLRDGFKPVIGNSRELLQIIEQIKRICHSDAPVHISGETGTGKELIARALHDEGPRAAGPFVVQNCASMTDTLLQSTLFGHRKGAFTGADRDHLGVFREADRGTLFLDEVGELSLAVQASLLRALQNGEIMPVGGSRPIKVDVRIISATNKDLREEVKAGRFRDDLFFRVMVITLALPPLRARSGDIPLLASHFLDLWCKRARKNIPGFAAETLEAFESYAWPGNVRELEHEIERLVVLAEPSHKIPLNLVSPHVRARLPHDRGTRAVDAGVFVPFGTSYDAAHKQLDAELIEHALAASSGVVSRAAEMLGMDRSRLSKMRKRL